MTCRPFIRQDWSPGAAFSPVAARYYLADTEADRPATAVMGDLCFTKDTKKLWKWHDGQWNDSAGAAGSRTPIDILLVNTSFVWTNMPAADTELVGNTSARFRVDLTGYTEYRWMVNVVVAGVSGADLRLQYAADDASYADLSSEIDIGTLGRKITAWASLPANARADVWVRVMGKQGNGAADPSLSQLRLQVR